MKPQLTLGIIGQINTDNITYCLNTILNQNNLEYEIIFCFLKSNNIEVYKIINTIKNVRDYFENIIIKEIENTQEIEQCYKYIIENATSENIFFMDINTAFYDSNAIDILIRNSKISNNIQSYRFLVNISNGEEWEVKQELYNVCIPIKKMKEINYHNIKNNFELYTKINKKYHNIEYIDENIVVHYMDKKEQNYLNYLEKLEAKQIEIVEIKNEIINFELLNYSEIQRLKKFACMKKKERKKSILIELSSLNYVLEKYKEVEYKCEYKKCLYSLMVNDQSFMEKIIFRKKLNQINKKKKIIFFVNEYSVWPSFKSLYEECNEARDFDTTIVYIPFEHSYSQTNHEKEISEYEKRNLKILKHNEYSIVEHNPDIVVYLKPYDSIPEEYQVSRIAKFVSYVLYIPYGMEIGNTKECLSYQCFCNMQYYATKIVAYSPQYYNKLKKYSFKKGENCLCSGHPRLDLINKIEISDVDFHNKVKEMAKNKIIVFWNSHFTVEDGDNWGTYLQFGEQIIQFIKENSEFYMIWRPHPLFYKAIQNILQLSNDELDLYIENKIKSSNIILDRSASYLDGFQLSDVMISDMNSFIPEYIAYNKPFIITIKNYQETIYDEFEEVKKAYSTEEIILFLEQVKKRNVDIEIKEKEKLIYIKDNISKDILNTIRNDLERGMEKI